jgi:hypothetical protein
VNCVIPIRGLFFSLACLVASAAQAVPVTYEFDGRVDYLVYGNAGIPFGGASPLLLDGGGSVTFDLDFATTAGIGTDPGPTSTGILYRATSPAFGSFAYLIPAFDALASFSSAGSNCADPASLLGVQNNDPQGMYFPPIPGRLTDRWFISLICHENLAPGVDAQRSTLIQFVDWTDDQSNPTLLDGLDPAPAFDQSAAILREVSFGYTVFDQNCVTCQFGIRETWGVGLAINSFSEVKAVPEPATPVLLLLGLAGIVVALRKRARAVV